MERLFVQMNFMSLKILIIFFDDVRKRCRRNCDDDIFIYLLTKFDFVLSVDEELDNKPKYNKKLGRYINYRGIREIIFEAFPELKKAYELKEAYILFNRTSNINNVKEELDKQIKAFETCGIKEYKSFYSLLINWKDEIINSFITVDGKRINNS